MGQRPELLFLCSASPHELQPTNTCLLWLSAFRPAGIGNPCLSDTSEAGALATSAPIRKSRASRGALVGSPRRAGPPLPCHLPIHADSKRYEYKCN